MADQLAKELCSRFERLKADRAVWESHWQEIRDFIRPNASSFTGIDVPGEKNRDNVLDNTAESDSKILQSALHGHLSNPGTKWFGLRAREAALNQVERVAEWLEAAADVLFTIFESPNSGFAQAIKQMYGELSDFGTAGMYIADRPGRVPFYDTRPLTELHIDVDNEGRVDTVYRDYEMTARAAAQEFGKDNLTTKLREAADSPTKAQNRFRFLHAVFPRAERRAGSRNAINLPVASVWLDAEAKEVLRQGGFHEFPYVIPRWEVRPGERYGRGPGSVALPDVKMLQREQKTTIKALEKAVRPPLDVIHDGVLGDIDMSESAINYTLPEFAVRGRRAIEPINLGVRPDIGEDHADRVRARIGRAYFNHLIQIERDPRMTATHVLKIDEETMLVMGPFLGQVQAEGLGGIIARSFGIALRAGMLPPPPPELAGQTIEVEYMSPLAKAQRLAEVRAVSQSIDVMRPLIDLDPALLDNLDQDRAFRHSADRLGVPHVLLRDPAQVEALRRARQQAAAEKAEAEQAAQGAAALQSIGQATAAFAGAEATRQGSNANA